MTSIVGARLSEQCPVLISSLYYYPNLRLKLFDILFDVLILLSVRFDHGELPSIFTAQLARITETAL